MSQPWIKTARALRAIFGLHIYYEQNHFDRKFVGSRGTLLETMTFKTLENHFYPVAIK